MFKKLVVTLLLLIIFGCNSNAQDKCNKYSESSIGVTFCAPQNWTIIKRENEPYSKVFGELHSGFTPNINIGAASFAGSLSQITDLVVEDVLKTKRTSKIEVKSKSEFVADTPGLKVVYELEENGRNIRSIQYFFKGLGDTKIVITATLLSSDAEVLENVIDASVKTFTVSDKPIKIGKQ